MEQSIAETVMAKIMTSSVGAKVRREVEATQLTKRQDLADKIDALESKQAQPLPKLSAAVDKAEGEVERARGVLKSATQGLRAALGAQIGLTRTIESQCNRLRGELRSTADPAIADFLGELQDHEEKLRTPIAVSQTTDPDGKVSYFSTKPGVDARRVALREARAKAERLQEAAIEDLPAALEAIRATIPDVGAEVKVGEEPYRPPGTAPHHARMS